MSEIRTMNPVLNRIFSPTQISDALRGTVREIAEAWGHQAGFESGDTARDDGIVFGGLVASGVSAAMYTQVTAGAALVPATRSLPLGNALFCFLADDETSNPASLLHSDGDGTFDRIDAITIKPSTATDTSGNPSTYPTGATSPAVDLERGCVITFNVIEGTPAASPAYPAVPTDELVLAYVLVPTGMTAGGGGMGDASVIYEDFRRVHSPKSVRNTTTGATTHYGRATDFNAFQALHMTRADGGGSNRSLAWRMVGADNWFAMRRGTVDSGDTSADLFPMCIPSGRTWKRTVGLERLVDNAVANATVDQVGYDVGTSEWGGFDITWSASLTASGNASQVILGDARGLQLIGVELEYNVIQTLSSGNMTARLYMWDQSAGASGALTAAENLTDSAGQNTHTFTLSPSPVLDEGDFVFVLFTLGGLSTATPAHYQLQAITCEVKEGRV